MEKGKVARIVRMIDTRQAYAIMKRTDSITNFTEEMPCEKRGGHYDKE